MLTEGGEGSPVSLEDQQMPAERVDSAPSVPQQPDVSPSQSVNVGLFGRLKKGLLGVLGDMKSGRVQRLNTHATPPLETSSQQPDSSQAREPGTS